MVSSIYSGPLNLRMSTDSVKFRQNYLGPDKTCLRSIRGVFVLTFDVCDTILKHFEKNQKIFKNKKVRFIRKILRFFENLEKSFDFFQYEIPLKTKNCEILKF